MNKVFGGFAAMILLASASSASAGYLVGTGDAQNAAEVFGGTVVNFESIAISSAPAFVLGDLTVTGSAALRVDNSFAGEYNGRDTRYLDSDEGRTRQFVFDFANAVTAFTFNWGAADITWSLAVFDGLTLLDTVAVAPTYASNAGDYIGYSASRITRAVITSTERTGDWVFIDNVSFRGAAAGVPEPGAWALMILGFGSAGAMLRRRRLAAA